jgi:hypothetical protein
VNRQHLQILATIAAAFASRCPLQPVQKSQRKLFPIVGDVVGTLATGSTGYPSANAATASLFSPSSPWLGNTACCRPLVDNLVSAPTVARGPINIHSLSESPIRSPDTTSKGSVGPTESHLVKPRPRGLTILSGKYVFICKMHFGER